MSVSRITDEACIEALEAVEIHGSQRQAAAALGLSRDVVRHRVIQAYQRGLNVDPAVQRGMDNLGANYEPDLLWIKTKGTNAEPGYSALMKKKKVDREQQTVEDIAALFRDTPAVQIGKTPPVEEGLDKAFCLLNLNDLHWNALAWGRETGAGDWDLKIAEERLRRWTMNLMARSPQTSEIILHFNGDTFHTNGRDPFTPKNGHVLDADTRYSRAAHMLCATVISIGDIAAQMFPRVRFVIRPGNHDRDSVVALQQGVFWRYRETEHVVVDIDPGEYWVYRRGGVMLASHHGDKAPRQRLVNYVSDRWRSEFGQSKHCYLWTAHGHREEVERIGAWRCEMASCISDQDAHAAEEAYPNSPSMNLVVYHEDRGEVERFSVSSWLV